MNMTFKRLVSLSTPLVLGGLLLAGCVGGPASLGGEHPLTPTSRYSLQAEPGLDRIALAVHDTGPSANQRAALSDLLHRFAVEGAEAIVVEAPTGGDPVSAAMAWNIKAALEALGAPPHRVRVIGYVAPDARAPVLAGFETVRAVVPQCGQSWGNLGRTGDNRSASNFGCAVSANLAAQIHNPRDIISPRDMPLADGQRRAVVFEHYAQGDTTSAVREELVTGARISNAVD